MQVALQLLHENWEISEERKNLGILSLKLKELSVERGVTETLLKLPVEYCVLINSDSFLISNNP